MHDRLLNWMNDNRDPFRGPSWERRPWRKERSINLQWTGEYRPRRPDGYAPAVLRYDTGTPFDWTEDERRADSGR